jgi:hypothetical protein
MYYKSKDILEDIDADININDIQENILKLIKNHSNKKYINNESLKNKINLYNNVKYIISILGLSSYEKTSTCF